MEREQHTRPSAGQGGFTLLEVIVAICILTVGLLGLASMQSSAIRGNHLGYRVTEATTLAQDRIEWLMMQDYDSAVLNEATDEPDPIGDAPSGYQITYDVADHAGVNAKLITVTVRMSEGGVTRTTRLRSLRPALL